MRDLAAGLGGAARRDRGRDRRRRGGRRAGQHPDPTTEFALNASFPPRALSRTEPTPISWLVSVGIGDEAGAHPPALRELTLELDQAIEVDTDGVPACARKRLGEGTESAAALEACRPALVGEGEAVVQVAHPEGDLVDLHSRLLVFNGGKRDGRTTLLVHAYFADPVAAALVVPVKIAKHRSGPFGSQALVRIPRVAEGYGSLTRFDLRTFKSVDVNGARLHPVRATCAAGKLRMLGAVKFEDGTKAQTEAIRGCTGRG